VSKTESQKPKKVYLEALILFAVNMVVFCGAFLLAFYMMKNKLHMQAVDVPLIKSGFDYNGLDTIVLIKKWTPLIGVGIGAAFSILLLLLMLIFTKLRRKSNLVSVILNLIVLIIFGLLAFDLVYLEPRFTGIGSAVKSFIGVPMGIAMIALTVLCVILFALKGFLKFGKVAVVLFFVSNITGCNLSSSSDIACELNPDSDHCHQFIAVQSGNSGVCEKIEGKSFEGQNPPKDKCYLMVAVNKGDYGICDKIQGGFNSYSKDQCLMEVAVVKKDSEKCKSLQDQGMATECASKIPQEGDNPLKPNEKAVAKTTNINGDVRVIKEDGRVIPLTRDSVLGPNDKIASMEEGSSFTIEIYGKGTYCVPQNTMLLMNSEMELLENACAAAPGIR